nr:hypothetical protein [Rhodococcus opacus]
MAFAGWALARLFRLDTGGARAVVFTGATRNSLVVLPLALALPDEFAVAAVVGVTQTLVEVIGVVACVRFDSPTRSRGSGHGQGAGVTGGVRRRRLSVERSRDLWWCR